MLPIEQKVVNEGSNLVIMFLGRQWFCSAFHDRERELYEFTTFKILSLIDPTYFSTVKFSITRRMPFWRRHCARVSLLNTSTIALAKLGGSFTGTSIPLMPSSMIS